MLDDFYIRAKNIPVFPAIMELVSSKYPFSHYIHSRPFLSREIMAGIRLPSAGSLVGARASLDSNRQLANARRDHPRDDVSSCSCRLGTRCAMNNHERRREPIATPRDGSPPSAVINGPSPGPETIKPCAVWPCIADRKPVMNGLMGSGLLRSEFQVWGIKCIRVLHCFPISKLEGYVILVESLWRTNLKLFKLSAGLNNSVSFWYNLLQKQVTSMK